VSFRASTSQLNIVKLIHVHNRNELEGRIEPLSRKGGKKMKHFFTMLLFTVILSAPLYAQKVIVDVPSDFGRGEGGLNNAVQAAINAGTLSNTTFRLELYGLYILTGRIVVPVGQTLEIVAPDPGTDQDHAPPQIVWTSSGGVNTNFTFECFGNISLKNVWLLYANTGGAQVGSSLQIQDNPTPNVQETATFENVIFDYSSTPQNASGAVGVTADHFVGTFKNCYFRNCTDTHLRYYGRALSFPFGTTGWHNDSVLFENCTFANMGYVYMQEGSEYGDNVKFNHCTFLNIMMFSLESGWWWKMSVTNSIFVNAYMLGDIPSGRAENSDPNGGTVRIDSVRNFGFSVPFTEQDRRILFAYNSYYIEDWLTDWMKNSPYSTSTTNPRDIPRPQPMLSPATRVFFDTTANGQKLFPYMNRGFLYDNANPNFLIAPTNITDIKTFINYKWTTNADINWAFDPAAGTNQVWPINENLSYLNSTLRSAGMGGFPLGDLYRWYPSRYTQWKAQAAAEDARIAAWLNTGKDPVTSVKEKLGSAVPESFTLGQNYPNPFWSAATSRVAGNPTTQIEYAVPQTGHVSLKVYNTQGQEVATLFDGVQQAGNYAATFDGAGLASGVYFYRLQSGNVVLTKKLVLMR
jgi:hypothetical protein